MKKIIGLILVIAIYALFAADNGEIKMHKQGEGIHAQQKQGHVCYNSIAFQASALEKQGKNEEAIKMLEDAKANAEYEHHYQMLFPSLVKLYEKTGQYDKCIALWNEGHQKNMTFGLDPAKEEYKPYLKLKGFKETVMKDRHLIKVKAKPELKPEEGCEDHEVKELKIEKKEAEKNNKEKR